MHRPARLRVALAVSAVILSACHSGGGDSNRAGDSTPDAFTIPERTNVARGATTDSSSIVVSGIDAPASVAVTGGQYSVNGAAYTSTPAVVTNGASVAVRLVAAAAAGQPVEAVLTIGGVSATFRVTTSTDVTAPTAAIAFPPAQSRTSGTSVVVRGTASDGAGGTVAAVAVNGVAATTTDSFATWTATVDLAPGDNALVVTARDGYLNTASFAAQAQIRRNARFGVPTALVAEADRMLVVDAAAESLFAVSSASGVRTWLSDVSVPGARREATLPMAMALDAARNRVLILDYAQGALVALDLTTRQRTVLASGFIGIDLLVDASRNRVLVLSETPAAVRAIDLTTGQLSVVSSATMPNALNPFVAPAGFAFDSANSRLLVVDRYTQVVFAVDVVTGARTFLSTSTVPNGLNPLQTPKRIEIDAAHARALVPQQSGSVIAVDLGTGARTVLSAPPGPGSAQAIYEPAEIVVEAARNRALVLDGLLKHIVAVDLDTGAQTIVSRNNPTDIAVPLTRPGGLAFDRDNNRLLVGDSFLKAVVEIDLRQPVGRVIADNTIPSSAVIIDVPTSLSLDARNGRVFVLESRGGDLYQRPFIFDVNLATGVRTIHASAQAGVSDIAFDGGANVLYSIPPLRTVFAGRFNIGNIIVSSPSFPNTTNAFLGPMGMAVDVDNGRALVADSTYSTNSRLLWMDMNNGVRTVLATNQQPSEQFLGPKLVTLDLANGRAFVADEVRQALFAVDLSTGARTFATSLDDPDNPFDVPSGLAYDPATRVVYALNTQFQGVLAIDTVTGKRVYLSY